jgi:hypothetical protein
VPGLDAIRQPLLPRPNEFVASKAHLRRPLPVTVPVTTVTPSRAQREPAPLDRIAICRAPSTGTVNEAHGPGERGALRLTHWLAVSQARIRALYFPQSATPVVWVVSVRRPRAPDPAW